jgi:large subunit ribosomal protein L24
MLTVPVKTHIKSDDKVRVIAGKDKDKVGKVKKVFHKKNRVIVENINIVKCHVKPNTTNRQGGIVEKEAPIHLSNVMLLCNHCVKPIRIAMKTLEDGQKVRICRKCNEIIDT